MMRYAVSFGTVVSLVAGRTSYRLVYTATTVLLLPVWGAASYNAFAAAMASSAWLLALVVTGPEKLALKLVPRSPRTGPLLVGALLAVLWWLPLPLVAAFAVAVAVGAGAPAVYLGAMSMQLSIGCTMLLVGLHRAYGRTRPDMLTFGTMSVVQLGMFGAAAAGWVRPVGFLAAVTAAQLCLNAVLAATLGRPSLAVARRPGYLRRLLVSAVLMSGTEMYGFLATGVLFVVLGASAAADQVGPLYALVITYSAGTGLVIFLLRVFAPRMSLAYAGRGGSAGRRAAARLARWIAVGTGAWLLIVVVLVAAASLAPEAPLLSELARRGMAVQAPVAPEAAFPLWVVLLASRAPMAAVALLAAYRFENTDATAPRVTAAAALLALIGVTASGVVAVPLLGGVGLLAATAVGELVYAAVVASRPVPGRAAPTTPAPRRPVTV